MALLVCLSTGALWTYLHFNLNTLLQQQADTYASTITQQAAHSAAEMVMADDSLALTAMLDGLVNHTNNIQSIHIYDDNGKLLSSAKRKLNTPEQTFHYYQNPIIFHDVEAGTIKLRLDNSAITQSLLTTKKILSVITLSTIFFAMMLSIFIARRLSKPLKKLQEVAQEVAKGNLSPDLPSYKNDEVGDLVRSFSHMLQGLRDKESIEHKFSSYLSKDIAKGILSDLNTSKKPLRDVYGSVLFVDIVGFTQLCEQRDPHQITDILNQYYFLLHQAAKMYRGTVDSYIGDGAMLTFGVHKEDKKHSINAICAAQIFIRLTHLMNAQRNKKMLPSLQFRLGLHCGNMLAGTIGSSERMQSTISGDSVNLAARLCEMAAQDKLMISDAIYQHPSTKNLLLTEPAQELSIKGKANIIKSYNVTGLAPKFNRLLMQQEAELEAMQNHE